MSDELDDITLEQATARLDEIAQRLGRSDLELSESLALYEEGVRLLRHCDGLMSAAEERIRQIREDGTGFRLDPLEERK